MKLLSFATRWLLLGLGTLNLISVVQPLAYALDESTSTSGNVETSLSLDGSEYNWNDTIDLMVHFENTGNEDIDVSSPDACFVDVRIEDEEGNTVSDPMSCAQVLTEFSINEVEEKVVEVPLDSLAGMPSGSYDVVVGSRATATLTSSGTSSDLIGAEARIPFELVGTVEMSYDLNKSEYSVDDIMTIDYTLTNTGTDPYEFSEGACRPYVTLYDASSRVVVFDERSQGELDCEETSLEQSLDAQGTYRGTKTFSLHDEGIVKGRYLLGLTFEDSTPEVGSLDVAPFGTSDSFYVVEDTIFNDIADHWAHDYIEVLYSEGVVEGYGAEFRPDQAVTRAEFLKIVYGAQHLDVLSEEELEASQSYFSDVDEEDWSYEYVQSAYANGDISGYGDDTFAPDQNITRAEAMSLLLLSVGYTDEQITAINPTNVFTDVTEEWQEKYILFAYHMGIVDGYHDQYGNLTWEFGPNNNLTRAEACKVALEARDVYEGQ